MASVFKNYTSVDVGTTPTTIYIVPASTTAVILGLNLANVTGSQVTVTAELSGTAIIKDAPVPSGSTLSILDGKLIAETGEVITITSDTATSVDVIMSVMEQS